MATTALDKKAALQKQIEDLQKKVQDLDQEAIHELKLKLSDARKVVRDFEDQLSSLTGQPAEKKPRVKRERRPSILDEHLQPQVLKVMADHGKTGMNAKQLAEKLNQDPLRVRKFIASNPKVLKRTGKGVGTKFFLP
jgi:septal ring factor EnvC (AmiA/AmiB activator)